MQVLTNPIAVMFLSFIIGVFADLVLRKVSAYGWMSGGYLFSNLATYEYLGVGLYRKILLATPLRLFNPNIKLPRTRDLRLLKDIRQHMATAEVSHWVGFAVMLAATVYAWSASGPGTGASFLFFNAVGNLYPCLLQQYNKRRLHQLIAAMEKRKSPMV
jgi:hypothetical protein